MKRSGESKLCFCPRRVKFMSLSKPAADAFRPDVRPLPEQTCSRRCSSAL